MMNDLLLDFFDFDFFDCVVEGLTKTLQKLKGLKEIIVRINSSIIVIKSESNEEAERKICQRLHQHFDSNVKISEAQPKYDLLAPLKMASRPVPVLGLRKTAQA